VDWGGDAEGAAGAVDVVWFGVHGDGGCGCGEECVSGGAEGHGVGGALCGARAAAAAGEGARVGAGGDRGGVGATLFSGRWSGRGGV